MKRNLEIAANVCIVVLSILLGYALVRTYLIPSSASSTQVTAPRPGAQLTQFGAALWPRHRRTLVLALRSGCHYCEASAPFYRRLVQMQASKGGDFGLLAVLPDDDLTARSYLSSEKLMLAFEPDIALTAAGILGTPTLIVVNNDGRVVKSWVGVLSSKQEKEVEEKLRGG
jgi:hypothetical protein